MRRIGLPKQTKKQKNRERKNNNKKTTTTKTTKFLNERRNLSYRWPLIYYLSVEHIIFTVTKKENISRVSL